MKIGPILFGTPMVQAIQREEDTKTQTRRAFEFNMRDGCNPNFSGYSLGEYYTGHIETGAVLYSRQGDGGWEQVTDPVKPRFLPGDIMWVRETWRMYEKRVGKGESSHLKQFYAYKADENNPNVPKCSEWYDNIKPLGLGLHENKVGSWRPAIHMPKAAARLFLRVMDVKAERLQKITAEDCIDEGIVIEWSDEMPKPSYMSLAYSEKVVKPAFVKAYATLWDGLNAKRGYGWNANPWVWVYTFERAEKPAGWPEVVAA